MKRIKVTDIFSYDQYIKLNDIEQMFLQAYYESNDKFDNELSISFHREECILSEYQKAATEELVQNKQEVGYLLGPGKKCIAVIGYIYIQ